MLKTNEDDMDDMKDAFLHSLIKNMSDGMVDDVRKSKAVAEPMSRENDVMHKDLGDSQGDERDEDEHEEEDEITSLMHRGRKMYPNSF